MATVRIICLADTHNHHASLSIPDGDILVHAGDFTNTGNASETNAFLDWLRELPHRHKILVAGNHDFYAERSTDSFLAKAASVPGMNYLCDSGVEVCGLKIWGSPFTPWFHHWAFNRQRGPEIDRHWSLIPDHTQVLVTHGPPQGKFDTSPRGEALGCWNLLQRTASLAALRLHVFGHIHAWGGRVGGDGAQCYANAAICNDANKPVRHPLIVTL